MVSTGKTCRALMTSNLNHFDFINRIDLNITPQRAVEQWGADPSSLQFVNQGINVVYRFTAHGQTYFLKITHAYLKTQPVLEANWDFLFYLAENGAPVSPPVLSADGQKVVAIPQGEEPFLATITQAIPGEPLPDTMMPEETFQAWGRALAQLHNAAESFRPTDPSLFLTWGHVWEEIRALIEPDDQAALLEFEQVNRWVQSLPEDSPDFGLTHADFRAGNMLLHNGRITILDFDEPVRHWNAADIARPFLELADHPLEDRRQSINWFIQGYRSTRPLDDFWVEKLPWFMRMKTLDIYAWSAANWDDRQTISRDDWIAAYQHRLKHPTSW